jgi:hypothetical protein
MIFRTAIEEIIVCANQDKKTLELLIHWKGGAHTQLVIERPRSATETATPTEALEIIRRMSVRRGDDQIASVLNRLGYSTGKAKRWNQTRVATARRNHSIVGQKRALPDPERVSLSEAARICGVSHHTIERLAEAGLLKREQVTPRAPWEIRRTDLDAEPVRGIIGRLLRTGKLILQGGCAEDQPALFTENGGDDKAGHHESGCLHPHVHCVIPAGGLSVDHSRWVHPRYPFFLPVEALSRVFRGKFVAGLKHLYRRGELNCSGHTASLATPKQFAKLLRNVHRQDWVVYAKPAFGGPSQVLRYLGRYTHRVAISNHRIVSFDGERATFRYKDYAHGGKHRVMSLTGVEFLRRFFLHILPKGFVRIRHFGFLANRWRRARLAICREVLGCAASVPTVGAAPMQGPMCWQCPKCGAPMIVVQRFTAAELSSRTAFFDSS